MREFRNISDHPEDLEDGRVVGVGETFSLDDDQLKSSYNKTRIDEGKFIDMTDAFANTTEPPTRAELLEQAKSLNIEGRTTMNMQELQQAINEAEEQKGGKS